jgi:hypothetical protein
LLSKNSRVESAALLGKHPTLNPVVYLSDIVPSLARGIEREDIAALMPKAWLHAHPAAAMTPLR